MSELKLSDLQRIIREQTPEQRKKAQESFIRSIVQTLRVEGYDVSEEMVRERWALFQATHSCAAANNE